MQKLTFLVTCEFRKLSVSVYSFFFDSSTDMNDPFNGNKPKMKSISRACRTFNTDTLKCLKSRIAGGVFLYYRRLVDVGIFPSL